MIRRTLVLAGVFLLGLLVGGALLSRSTPRSLLAVTNCEGRCTDLNELTGLLASAAIQWAPTLIPGIERESAACLAVRHPRPEGRTHFVLFPKRDVRNILEVSADDQPYVFGCFALARELALSAKAQNYRLITNGPALQHVAYLHFHLIAK